MILVFFDFYPIITRSDTLGEVLSEASFYFLFEKSNLIVLLGYFVLSFTSFARAFRRKGMIYSVVLALFLMLGLGAVEKQFFTMKLSDLFMKVAYNFVVISLGYLMLFFIPFFLSIFLNKPLKSSNFRSLSQIELVVFLGLFFTSSCGYSHVSYLPVVLITLMYGWFLYSKSQKLEPIHVSYEFKDLVPLVMMTVLGVALAFTKICSIPFLSSCFSCH